MLPPVLAARFPEPATRYSTPGLKDGRTQWSTREEAAAWLRELASPPAARNRSNNFKATVLNLSDPAEAAETAADTRLYALHLSNVSRTARSAEASTGTDADIRKEPLWRPTVLLITGGEPSAATEAMLVVARELVRGKLRPLLARINVVVVPSTNFGVALQTSPVPALANQSESPAAEDHVQLNTARARMLADLAQAQQATVVLTADEAPAMETINGQTALRLADVAMDHAHQPNLPEFLTRAAEQWFHRPMRVALQAETLRVDGSQSLLASDTPGAKEGSSTSASALKNRIGLQVVTAGSDLGRAHAQRRVHAQVTAISSALSSAAKRSAELAELKPYLDREVVAQACRQAVLITPAGAGSAQAGQGQMPGAQWLDLNTGAEMALALPVTSAPAVSPVRTRIKPCGYWLSAEFAPVVERLRIHGVEVMRVAEPASLLGDTYLPSQGVAPGHDVVRGVIDAPPDSFYVRVDQPFGNLVVAALEPDAPSGFPAHGSVNSAKGLARVMAPPAVRLEPLP